MAEQGEAFEELAYALVQALDEWSECLQEVMEGPGPSRSGLVARLRDADPKIDNPLLGHWLLGRDQLLGENKRSGRVPTVQDTARIVEAFRADSASQSRRLMGIAKRIEFHRIQLHKIKGHQWRSAVVKALKAPEQPSPPPGPADAAVSPESTDLPPVPADDTPAQAPAAGSTAQAVPSEDSEQPAADPTAPPTTADPPAPAASSSWKRPTTVVAAVGLLIALAIAAKGWSGSTEQGGQAELSSSSATSTAGTTAQSSDALGEDSRCSPPKTGPSGVQLRACARVRRDKVAFALKVDNPTASAVKVTVKVGGFWAGAAHDCKPGPATTHITVEPGTTFTTDPAHCETARQDAPLAYQGQAYIAAGDGQEWIGHAFSPRANVYADRGTLWRCGSDVPC
ncbi:hypothetical protein [Embleya sp. NBC_00896]|uniref:hypothetical protein n=1 Tax=Embleya sp. NBC_00896 TaxID=2975961 RepID=UPI00386C7793|nr:hypothetical protein OG928_14400 [Embleya sp. NBC_00896]